MLRNKGGRKEPTHQQALQHAQTLHLVEHLDEVAANHPEQPGHIVYRRPTQEVRWCHSSPVPNPRKGAEDQQQASRLQTRHSVKLAKQHLLLAQDISKGILDNVYLKPNRYFKNSGEATSRSAIAVHHNLIGEQALIPYW